MKIPFVDLHAQYVTIKPEIDAAIADVIQQSSYIRGPYVEKFETAFAAAMGVRNCISCANGTDALYIAMKALGLRPGDEVITTAHSWISTSETITQAGGRVVFCDTDDATFTIDPRQIESLISPRTVGIIPVHLYGHPADMKAIMGIAKRHGLWVIEDCAQAHFATCAGQLVGTFGQAATFSFYPGKNLGAYGDAGAIITNDDKMADWMATYARHGGKGEHIIEGINSRMDGLQGAILGVKLGYIEKWTNARRRIANAYNKRLMGIGDIVIPLEIPGNKHVYHLYVIRTNMRNELKEHLNTKHINTALNYPKALPFYPAYSYLRHQPTDFPVAHKHQSQILSLPIFPELTVEMIDYVGDALESFFKTTSG
jgi:dTDP-4-amino-4,6-dideoxygalactose transaminase